MTETWAIRLMMLAILVCLIGMFVVGHALATL